MDDTEFTFDLVPQGEQGNTFNIPNLPGMDFRQGLYGTPNESSPLSMKIKLVEVHHGRMIHENKQCGGTLLLLEMNFLSSDQDRRYESAIVTLEFFDKGGDSKYHPVVVGQAPNRMHWLNKTTRERTTTYGANAGASGGAGPVGLEAGVQWQVETKKPTKYKATLTGRNLQSAGYFGAENAVKWSMTENTDERDGIPTFLQAPVLLKTHASRPFLAKLRVSSNVDFVSKLRRASPTSTDEDKIIDHVTFTPGKTQLWNRNITHITPEDLESMERLPLGNYLRVNMSEQDDLLAPGDAPTVAPQDEGGVQAAPARIPSVTPEITAPTSLAVIAEALRTAAAAAATAAEAASKSAEAAGKAADAAVKVAEALSILTAAVKLEEQRTRVGR